MPELPEVESLRLGLEKILLGQKIINIKILNSKIVVSNGTKREFDKVKENEFINNLKGKNIVSIDRRAKNIIFNFDTDEVMIVHLKMTGQLLYENQKNKHTHIIFELERGVLHYNDVRKFGYVLYYKNLNEAIRFGHFKNIGAEPFDKGFTLDYFRENILKKNKKIKTVLLEQSVVVGCGNIYADEACFASKVLPDRNCKTLTEVEIKSLYQNIKSILKHAIKAGGSSISDYLLPDGTKGKYANSHKVYGRSGMPCSICGNILEKSIVSGRATVYCNTCQK